MRYSRKLENQLCLLFGHTYRLKRGLKHIQLKPPIHDAHLKKKMQVSRPQGSDFMALGQIRNPQTEKEKNHRQPKIAITGFLPKILNFKVQITISPKCLIPKKWDIFCLLDGVYPPEQRPQRRLSSQCKKCKIKFLTIFYQIIDNMKDKNLKLPKFNKFAKKNCIAYYNDNMQ